MRGNFLRNCIELLAQLRMQVDFKVSLPLQKTDEEKPSLKPPCRVGSIRESTARIEKNK